MYFEFLKSINIKTVKDWEMFGDRQRIFEIWDENEIWGVVLECYWNDVFEW